MALWGSGYDRARAFIEIEHRGKLLQGFWTEAGATQQPVKQAVTEAMRGGFTLRVTMVRENRGYLESRHVDVPWTNKNLTVKWEHFVSKLEPGQKETWTAVIAGVPPLGDCRKAGLQRGLWPRWWPPSTTSRWTPICRTPGRPASASSARTTAARTSSSKTWPSTSTNCKAVGPTTKKRANHLSFAAGEHHGGPLGIRLLWGRMGGRADDDAAQPMAPAWPPSAACGAVQMEQAARPTPCATERARQCAGDGDALADGKPGNAKREARRSRRRAKAEAGGGQPGPRPDLSQVAARKNLNETAFFFPHLLSDAEGKVKLEFTMPEALTKWKFLGFAHDAELRGGLLTDEAVTAKDLMVQPNPPRFLREGDELEFTVKVTNQSATRQSGKVRLSFSNARTGKSIDAFLGNTTTDQGFDLAAKESHSFSWRLTMPDSSSGGAVAYKAVGSTGRVSDGEEGLLPVLVRRTLVTESLPLPIRGPETKQFKFDRLLKSGESKTLQSQNLTVQMVSNPAWYAVMALPYLMDYPYECYEQTFNRLYANALARHIANSDPKIHRVFEQWRGTPALDSPLEKNQDLKSVMLEETPWVRQAQAESQARRNVGILFEDNRLNDETARTLKKLAEGQYQNGAWPWFPGGPPCEYITLYITTGFGRLRHLGVKLDMQPAVKSLARLDGWIDEIYREILRTRATRTTTTSARRSRSISTAAASSWRIGRSPRRPRRRSITSSARPASIGWRWPTASRRPTWPWP